MQVKVAGYFAGWARVHPLPAVQAGRRRRFRQLRHDWDLGISGAGYCSINTDSLVLFSEESLMISEFADSLWENIDIQEDLTRHSAAAHVKAFQEATKGNIEAKVEVFQSVWGPFTKH